MGRFFNYVRSAVRDPRGYPLRGMDEVGPPPQPKRFEDYMEDDTFLQALPRVIRDKLKDLYKIESPTRAPKKVSAEE